MDLLENFAIEQYDPKRFEQFLSSLKAPVGEEENKQVTNTLLNPTAILLTPANAKGMVTMLSDGKGGAYIPAYTTLQMAMRNIQFDPNCKMVPCSIGMYATMMEHDPKIAGLSINFVQIPGQAPVGMAISRENVLSMKEPYMRIVKAYKELGDTVSMTPVSLFAPDEIKLASIRVSVGELLKGYPEIKTGHVCQTSRREKDNRVTDGIFYVLEGSFEGDSFEKIKEALVQVSRKFLPEDWTVEAARMDSQIGKKVLPGTIRFY